MLLNGVSRRGVLKGDETVSLSGLLDNFGYVDPFQYVTKPTTSFLVSMGFQSLFALLLLRLHKSGGKSNSHQFHDQQNGHEIRMSVTR
jgi:hypothetical protein